jgi:hypothetical protein
MLNFLHRSGSRYPTIREALVQSGVPGATNPATITVVETDGLFSGRHVNFFRAFAPAHKEVLLGSGHVEKGGLVVVDARSAVDSLTPAREPADRAGHKDDERLVFWDAEGARVAEAALSAPAATWLQAKSTPRSIG